jgi:hypothetical protein
MPRPRNERQPLEEERGVELPAQLAQYRRDLDATPKGERAWRTSETAISPSEPAAQEIFAAWRGNLEQTLRAETEHPVWRSHKRPQVGQGVARCPPPFRPEVPRIARMSAQFEGDEMVFLVVSRRLVRQMTLLKLLPFEAQPQEQVTSQRGLSAGTSLVSRLFSDHFRYAEMGSQSR